MSKFLVVKGGDQYNAVIGRPTLRALRAVTSIYHQIMKFPTLSGIGKARGNQYESRLTYSETIRHYTELTQVRRELRMVETRADGLDLDPRFPGEESEVGPVEELVEVPVDERDPTRTLRVGSELEPQDQGKLVGFLKGNLNVFAWTHEDMEGISPDVMCH